MTDRSGRPLLIVDAANVVGSVPDGWWRDRLGANERLRDRLAPVSGAGVAGIPGPIDVIMVVEGQARSVAGSATVEVIAASGSGDDAIVAVTEQHQSRRCIVVTADRGLRDRVTALGAEVIGPSTIR